MAKSPTWGLEFNSVCIAQGLVHNSCSANLKVLQICSILAAGELELALVGCGRTTLQVLYCQGGVEGGAHRKDVLIHQEAAGKGGMGGPVGRPNEAAL